jgi:uncharacterized protein (TIGR00255 family)
MTGFATQNFAEFSWEIRSVNHRYLETHFKLPEDCRALEPTLRARIKASVKRGKVDCTLRRSNRWVDQINLDPAALTRLLKTLEGIDQQSDLNLTIDGLGLLAWPGVLTETSQPLNDDRLLSGFDETLGAFNESRLREGQATALDLIAKITDLRGLVAVIKKATPTLIKEAQSRLMDRIEALDLAVDAERLHQEVVLLTSKADVNEELERLASHINEVSRCLESGGVAGRRLDFLMQELNREANTLSSKSIAAASTQDAVELKVVIEQMREQIQNLE